MRENSVKDEIFTIQFHIIVLYKDPPLPRTVLTFPYGGP